MADGTFPVLRSQARAFGIVFDEAQNVLRDTFGMELVELREKTKGAVEPATNGQTQVVQAAQAKGKGKKRTRRNIDDDEEEEDEDEAEDEVAVGKRKTKCMSSMLTCSLA